MSTFSRAEDIAAELESRLAGITIANGFETDIGTKVFLGKRKVEDSDAPCSVLIEGDDKVTDTPGRIPQALVLQQYILGAYDECDPDKPNTKAHAIIRDLKRCVFKSDTTFGGKVKQIFYKGRDIGPRTDGVGIVFALIEIEVKFVEDLTNP